MFERAWLIDDNDIDNFIATTILENEYKNIETKSFSDAVTAWQAIKNTPPNKLPDLIVLDCYLPLMSSDKFMQHLTESWENHIKKPIICLVSSSLNQKEIMPLMAHPWVKGHITKPLFKDSFIKTLENDLLIA